MTEGARLKALGVGVVAALECPKGHGIGFVDRHEGAIFGLGVWCQSGLSRNELRAVVTRRGFVPVGAWTMLKRWSNRPEFAQLLAQQTTPRPYPIRCGQCGREYALGFKDALAAWDKRRGREYRVLHCHEG